MCTSSLIVVTVVVLRIHNTRQILLFFLPFFLMDTAFLPVGINQILKTKFHLVKEEYTYYSRLIITRSKYDCVLY